MEKSSQLMNSLHHFSEGLVETTNQTVYRLKLWGAGRKWVVKHGETAGIDLRGVFSCWETAKRGEYGHLHD